MSDNSIETPQVDVRGPRFAAWVTTGVLIAALLVSAAPSAGGGLSRERSARMADACNCASSPCPTWAEAGSASIRKAVSRRIKI